MAHTYTVLLYHIIFSTKGREPLLTREARTILFPYMAGIIANQAGMALIINGVADHVHVLCRLKSKPDVAEVVQAIKGGSSAWFNKESGLGALHWQEGYGAFTVSYSQRDRVFRYIQNQEAHHRKQSFAEEFEAFLIKHGVEYDRRFFLD
jgi:REP element-mobilizing transposase RayT